MVLGKLETHGIIRIMKLSLLGKSWRRVIKMKVLLINGSPNEKGSTYTALCEVEKS